MMWYEKVRQLYPDASDAIDYFKEKKISMGEVTTLQPGEATSRSRFDYRNIKEAALEIYKVDLMKLYLREKNLSNITAVDLAGIDPESSLSIPLGDGKDFADKTKKAKLPIKEEGAYLVICRGDNLYTSGLILITPLKLEIQETPAEGSVRVNVRDLTAGGNYIPEVLVKVVGTQQRPFPLRPYRPARRLPSRGHQRHGHRPGQSRGRKIRLLSWTENPRDATETEHAGDPTATAKGNGSRADQRQETTSTVRLPSEHRTAKQSGPRWQLQCLGRQTPRRQPWGRSSEGKVTSR